MARVVLITGGAKSGKSLEAERLVREMGGAPVYVATAEALDGEMVERINAHRERRGDGWRLIEEPRDLARVLEESDGAGPRLVDCLTLWLTNEMLADGGDWRGALDKLLETLGKQSSPVVLVTNEVGAGIVPDNALARAFQDAAGVVNQAVGAVADEVILVVAGCALRIKG